MAAVLLLPSLLLAAPDAGGSACRLGPSTCVRDEQGPKACTAAGGLCDRCLPYFAGGRFNAAVSRQGCACLCSRLGWLGVAGVENGNNCFCANASSPRTHCGQALPASACAVPCNGNRSATCGGNMAVEIFNFECTAGCAAIPTAPPAPPAPPRPKPPPPPPPGPFRSTYPWPPTIHWAQGCLEGRVTHDISGGIIQCDGTYHTWIGCFNAQPGGGWQHIVSTDLLTWKLASPFTATALPPFTQGRHIEAGAVGIDDDGTAFAVEGYPTSGTGPYNAYRFTNSSNDAWEEPSELFSFVSTRALPGDPPRPWRDPRDNRWYALLSFNGCNETIPTHPEWKSNCPRGGEAKMWSSPQVFGPEAKWVQTASLLVTNRTILDGTNGLPLRPSTTEMVTSDFFPMQGHPKVNAVFLTSRYDRDSLEHLPNPDPDGAGFWNYLIAYVGHQAAPGEPMTVLHRACLDWSAFVRTSGWHGIDAATNAGTTYGIGKSMRSAEGKGDTGRRVLFAWMTNGYWDGSDAVVRAPGLPKDSLSLPRDMTFAPDGRLLQQFVPELRSLRVAGKHEQLPMTALNTTAPVWLKMEGRQLELVARFEVAGNASFGLHVLASRSMAEYTTVGVDTSDDLTFIDRRNSSGAKPLVPSKGVLDVRAGVLPPPVAAGGGGRVVTIHAIVDGPIVTYIVDNETAMSVYVYPQLNSSGAVGVWAGGGAKVKASAEAWQLRSPFGLQTRL